MKPTAMTRSSATKTRRALEEEKASAENRGPPKKKVKKDKTLKGGENSIVEEQTLPEKEPEKIEPLKYEGNSIVKVLVGANETVFMIPKQRLCEVSRFFRAACNGPFKEGVTGVVQLPEVTPKNFDLFVNWLYTGKINAEPAYDALCDDEWWTFAVDTYNLATYLNCKQFKRCWMDYLTGYGYENASSCSPPSSTTLNQAYESTTRHCGLQRLLSSIGTWNSDNYIKETPFPTPPEAMTEYWHEQLQAAPMDYIVDLVVEMQKALRRPYDYGVLDNEKIQKAFRDD